MPFFGMPQQKPYQPMNQPAPPPTAKITPITPAGSSWGAANPMKQALQRGPLEPPMAPGGPAFGPKQMGGLQPAGGSPWGAAPTSGIQPLNGGPASPRDEQMFKERQAEMNQPGMVAAPAQFPGMSPAPPPPPPPGMGHGNFGPPAPPPPPGASLQPMAPGGPNLGQATQGMQAALGGAPPPTSALGPKGSAPMDFQQASMPMQSALSPMGGGNMERALADSQNKMAMQQKLGAMGSNTPPAPMENYGPPSRFMPRGRF